jgi:hypothetical protein
MLHARTQRPAARPVLVLAAACLAACLAGCAAPRSGQPDVLRADAAPPVQAQDVFFDVAPGGYAAAFDAVRDELTRRRFTLDRVDARAGVISTLPKGTAGLATPWDTEQSTAAQEVDDGLNQQERVVRVVFAPAGGGQAIAPDPGAPLPDLRTYSGPMTARVEVRVDRVRRPGWRLEPESIRRSTRMYDPGLAESGIGTIAREPIAADPALAQRISDRVTTALAQPSGG